MKKLFSVFLLVLTFVALAACNSAEKDIEAVYQGSPEDFNANKDEVMKDFDQTAAPKAGDPIAVMETSMGTIRIKLFPEFAPKTVENFTGLAGKGYYDGLIFHRVIPDFMIQGGDPMGNGMGGTSLWGNEFEDEFSPNLKNLRGTLSMANHGPNTNGSQFFIVQKEGGTPWLDGHHTVFGQVVEGMDVVDSIASADRDKSDKPLEEITLEKLTIETQE